MCVCAYACAYVCVCVDAYTCMFLCTLIGIHNAKHQECNILLCIRGGTTRSHDPGIGL